MGTKAAGAIEHLDASDSTVWKATVGVVRCFPYGFRFVGGTTDDVALDCSYLQAARLEPEVTMSVAQQQNHGSVARWAVGGVFLEAFASRDYGRMNAILDPAVRLQAMLPEGPTVWEGAAEVTGTFRSWFGETEEFELIDAAVGEVIGRLHVSWRVRVRATPPSCDGWRVIEQHAYIDAGETIESIDLLSSGFRDDWGSNRLGS